MGDDYKQNLQIRFAYLSTNYANQQFDDVLNFAIEKLFTFFSGGAVGFSFRMAASLVTSARRMEKLKRPMGMNGMAVIDRP